MTYFSTQVYNIIEESQRLTIDITNDITLILRGDEYSTSDEDLLKKILKSVGQNIDKASLMKTGKDQFVKINATPTISDGLVIVFGLKPRQCSLQIDERLHTLIKLSDMSIIFSSSLSSLPDNAGARKDLWYALKHHFQIS